jgi:hypothetical protein
MRECLVDGDVKGNTLAEFYHTRKHFIAQNYAGYSEGDYDKNTISEFNKLKDLPKGSEIILWFERDLFCQVKVWFVMFLLHDHHLYHHTNMAWATCK